jgi:hypothetical protein
MKQTRLKAVNRKRGGSSFPKRRVPEYCDWVRAQPCLLSRWTDWNPLIENWPGGGGYDATSHGCIGPVQVCHVKSRGAGGDDRRNVIALCAMAHDEQHRIGIPAFEKRWGVNLKAEAERLDHEYVRSGGGPPERETPNGRA